MPDSCVTLRLIGLNMQGADAPWNKDGVANEVGRTHWRDDVDSLAAQWAPINEKRKAEAAARKAARKAGKKPDPVAVASTAVTPVDSPAPVPPAEDEPAKLDSDAVREMIEADDGAVKRASEVELDEPPAKRARRSASSETLVGEPVDMAELSLDRVTGRVVRRG